MCLVGCSVMYKLYGTWCALCQAAVSVSVQQLAHRGCCSSSIVHCQHELAISTTYSHHVHRVRKVVILLVKTSHHKANASQSPSMGNSPIIA